MSFRDFTFAGNMPGALCGDANRAFQSAAGRPDPSDSVKRANWLLRCLAWVSGRTPRRYKVVFGMCAALLLVSVAVVAR